MSRKYILLFGGQSDERLVSVASAQAMAEAIGPSQLWFWHKDGAVFSIKYDELIQHRDPFTKEFTPTSKPIFNTIEKAVSAKESDNHIFILALHGGAGEDGELQAILEKENRAFTGSKSEASRRAFNKVATKEILRSHAIKMAPQFVIDENSNREHIASFLREHGEIILKPIAGGSSIGCIFCRNDDDLVKAYAQIFVPDFRPYMAEKIICGTEITTGVIETDHGLMALPSTEIALERSRDFDYEGKYLGKGAKEITPARLDRKIIQEAERIAISAHQILGLDGYSRVDMIVGEDGVYFIEINTLPGLTKTSLVPQQLAVAGISLRDFLYKQISLAENKLKEDHHE